MTLRYVILGDIAVEVSKYAKKTILSTSHGSYIIGRLSRNGDVPLLALMGRLASYLPTCITSFLKKIFITYQSNYVADIGKWNLKPESTLSLIINDEILHRIAYGKVEVRRGTNRIEEKTVYFSDGKMQENVDTIILCTGYVRKFPFLDENIFSPQRQGKYLPLYKGIFPVKYNSSLAFVGMVAITNTFTFTAEMQARFVAERFKKNIKLPEEKDMETAIVQHVKRYDELCGGNIKELNQVRYFILPGGNLNLFHVIFPLNRLLYVFNLFICFIFYHNI